VKISIKSDYREMSKEAAGIVADAIRAKPNLVLGLATGSTPLGMYKELIRIHKEEGLDFSQVVTFNLDEFCGVSPNDKQSYHYYMYENLFSHININPQNIHIPDGNVEEAEEFCRIYDKMIEEHGPIDLQVLGIGRNGHIGFNEPADKLAVDTHVTPLAEETRRVISNFFDKWENVPKKAITMGLGAIMKAKKILLLANGKKKVDIMRKFIKDRHVTTKLPASFLHLHPNVTVVMDKEAAG
jgi:glucosamine-6-phosphate deaminase